MSDLEVNSEREGRLEELIGEESQKRSAQLQFRTFAPQLSLVKVQSVCPSDGTAVSK